MIATNHALTGALIGLSVVNPLIAFPLAVLSHFVCDAIPHYGPSTDMTGSKRFRNSLVLDATLCVLLVAVLFTIQPVNWLVAAVCAFLAASPDLMWVPKFRQAQSGLKVGSNVRSGWPLRYHAAIQWFERPIGIAVELAWAMAAVILLKVYLI